MIGAQHLPSPHFIAYFDILGYKAAVQKNKNDFF
jgi:hypothetical protein